MLHSKMCFVVTRSMCESGISFLPLQNSVDEIVNYYRRIAFWRVIMGSLDRGKLSDFVSLH